MGISYFESAGIDTVPSFLTAKTPNGLRRAMLKNNVKHKGFVVYQDIQWVQNEKLWYAWFYLRFNAEDVNNQKLGDLK